MSNPNWGYDALDSMTLGTCVYCGEISDDLNDMGWCWECIKAARLDAEREKAELEAYYAEERNE